MNSSGWSEYEKHVLAELERLNKSVDKIREESQTSNAKFQTEIAVLKVKAGVWGLAGGLIPAMTALVFWLIGK